ncbi:MAG: glycosyltransferase [Treponema sp.]|nr:glycosyltransferase [Treponema sp.]
MTIVHVLEPFSSGVTTAVISIAKALPEYPHIVIHGSRNWTESAEKVKLRFPSGVVFIEWKNAGRELNPIKDWKAYWDLVSLLKKYKKSNDTVIHLHSSKAGFLGRLACRFIGIKNVIYTPHCGAFLRKDIGIFKRKLYRFLEWLGGCFGGRVSGCGPSEGELYKKLGKNTVYVSNGVNIINMEPGIINDDDRLKRNLISFTGIASVQKDPAMWSAIACECYKMAHENGFSFCWIGDGPLADKIDRGCVDVTGWKSASDVEALLDNTSVYFSSSAWEGLPYGVLEAMAHGCAVLLRDVPGNRDLVSSGENGYLFKTEKEAQEHLNNMLKDRNLLAGMGMKSIEIVKNDFSIKKMGDGYRKFYKETVEGNI